MDFSTFDVFQSNAGSFAWASPRQAVPGIESVNTGPDFSAWAMFQEASLVVQIVMVILIVASLFPPRPRKA